MLFHPRKGKRIRGATRSIFWGDLTIKHNVVVAALISKMNHLRPTSLRSFLLSAKTTLKDAVKHSLPVTFVVGNESAGILNRNGAIPNALINPLVDLDSICCAVVLAYLKTYAPSSKSFHVPLSNLARADLSLRPELIPVLKHSNLGVGDLVTLDELDKLGGVGGLTPEKTRWILVDHNALQGQLGRLYAERVVGCIDHHDEENKVPRGYEGEPRVVKPCGSCTSLVVKECMGLWDELVTGLKDDKDYAWNYELAKFAMAPILIDTNNLKSKAKTKPTDQEAVEYLEQRILANGNRTWNSEEYFNEIFKAKEDIGGLSLKDILRKDYKQWTEGSMDLGISSVVKDISFLIEKAGNKENLFATIEAFAKERGLSICSIITTSHQEGKFRRELLVWAMDKNGVTSAKKFEADSKERLGLESWKDGQLDIEGKEQWRKCWWQLKVEHSRKQVAPFLRATMIP